MGYFTETMALFEFKGDAETAYAGRNALEKFSGDHKIGRAMYATGKSLVNSNNDVRNSKEYVRHAVDSKEGKRIADSVSKDKDARDVIGSAVKTAYKYGKGKDENLRKNIDRYQNGSNKGIKDKSVRESFSDAFDSVIL